MFELLAFASFVVCPEDLPPLTDVHRFPGEPVAVAAKKFNQDFRNSLAGRSGMFARRADREREALAECCRRWQVWENVHWLTYQPASDHQRRQALGRLREQLGERDYAAGQVPLPVPIWACWE